MIAILFIYTISGTLPHYTTDCSVLTAPTGIDINVTEANHNDMIFDISWNDAPCDVDNYTVHYADRGNGCENDTVAGNETTHTVINGLTMIQIGAHRNGMTNCSQGMLSCNNNPYTITLKATIFSSCI